MVGRNTAPMRWCHGYLSDGTLGPRTLSTAVPPSVCYARSLSRFFGDGSDWLRITHQG